MNQEYWNDAASKGAILGGLMLASHIVEQSSILSGSITAVTFIGLEMLVVAAIYIYLLYRFAKKASVKFADSTLGFSYSQALMYIVCITLFAGVIVGLGGYVYTHYIIGYENYTDRMIAGVQQMLQEMGGSPSIPRMYNDMLQTLAEQSEPSILSTIASSIFSYGLWGLFIGLFIAAGVKREPQIFDNDPQEPEQI